MNKFLSLFMFIIFASCSASGNGRGTIPVGGDGGDEGATPSTSFSFDQITSTDANVNLSVNNIHTILKKDTILQDADRRAPTTWYTLSTFPLSTSALYDSIYPALRDSFGKSGNGTDRFFLPRFKASSKGDDYIVLRMLKNDITYQLKQKVDSDTMWFQGIDSSDTAMPISILVSTKGNNFDTVTNLLTDYYSAHGTETSYEGSISMKTTDGRTINVYIVSHDPPFTASVDFYANPMKYVMPINDGYKEVVPSSTQDFTDIYPLNLALTPTITGTLTITGKLWAVTSSEVKEIGCTYKSSGTDRFTGSYGASTYDDWPGLTIQGQYIQPIYLRRMYNTYYGQILTRYNGTFNNLRGDTSSPYYDKLFTYLSGGNDLPGLAQPLPIYAVHYGFFKHPGTKKVYVLSVDPNNGVYGAVREFEMKFTKTTTAPNTWYRHVQTNTSGFESIIEVHPR